tara:strand:+ start:347 stop:610 length:264 start_codon:yes stop_codon:yes gene_type:complete
MAAIENDPELEESEEDEEEGEDILGSDEEEDEDEYEADMYDMLSSFLSAEDDNVCTAMLKVSKQLEIQNKVMVKILTQLSQIAQKGS